MHPCDLKVRTRAMQWHPIRDMPVEQRPAFVRTCAVALLLILGAAEAITLLLAMTGGE